jgi:uncharacterized phage infection (PIP) family protein YhgE
MARSNLNEFNRKMREAQRELERDLNNAERKAQQELKREVDRVNRHNKRVADDCNRKIDTHNRKVVADAITKINALNRKANTHNERVIADINQRLRSPSSPVWYTDSERSLTDRVHQAVGSLDSREYDSFLSYEKKPGQRAIYANIRINCSLTRFYVTRFY